MGPEQDWRDRIFNRLYWLVLAGLAIAAASNWLTGFPSNHITHFVYWAFMGVCVLGLVNVMGIFGRR
jgi:FtsH-binding integral membrane protein